MTTKAFVIFKINYKHTLKRDDKGEKSLQAICGACLLVHCCLGIRQAKTSVSSVKELSTGRH